MESAEVRPASITKLAAALRGNFFFLGILLGGWSTRIPELKSALNMSDATLGKTLMGAACGALFTSRFIGWLVRNLGPKRVFYIGMTIFPLGYLTIAYALNAFFVFLGIFLFTMGYILIDNPMTIMTQELERVSDRKYLSGFHAFWSIGTLTAAFFGSFLIGHVKYSYHLTGIAVISFTFMSLTSRKFKDQVKNSEKVEKISLPWFSGKAKIVWAVGLGMLCANSAEFGATDWSALFLRDVLSIKGQLYVGAYIAFEAGMILSRLSGDKYIHKYGPARVIQVCGYLAGSAWFISTFLGVWVNESNRTIGYLVVLFGYFLAGAGVGPLFPSFITILGSVKDMEISVAFARTILIATIGFAFVPALIGAISEVTSLKTAMVLPMALLLVAGYMSRASKLASK